jgi:hypothetical protein
MYFECSQCSSNRNWTLHSSPSPAYPSYRLITALRLYHINLGSASGIIPQEVLQPWHDTLLGRRSMVSDENEAAWRESLAQICGILKTRAETEVSRLTTRTADIKDVSWLAWMQDNIQALWQEEVLVAAAVAESVRHGVQF